MARGNNFFKGQFNKLLRQFEKLEPGADLGSETALAASADASRTTIRAILSALSQSGIILWEGREKRLLRRPRPEDYFVESETFPLSQQVETLFLEWVFQSDQPPGKAFSEAELARSFGISTGAVREFLIRFEPFGLIEKHQNRHWLLKGFTREFAEEMFEVREMFERRALEKLMRQGLTEKARRQWQDLKLKNDKILKAGDEASRGFPTLDAEFHKTLCGSAGNRFILDFSRMIAIIVHYHYQWNKRDETARNKAAAAEHGAIIEAVLAGDPERALKALDRHLDTARDTLMASVSWPQNES